MTGVGDPASSSLISITSADTSRPTFWKMAHRVVSRLRLAGDGLAEIGNTFRMELENCPPSAPVSAAAQIHASQGEQHNRVESRHTIGDRIRQPPIDRETFLSLARAQLQEFIRWTHAARQAFQIGSFTLLQAKPVARQVVQVFHPTTHLHDNHCIRGL